MGFDVYLFGQVRSGEDADFWQASIRSTVASACRATVEMSSVRDGFAPKSGMRGRQMQSCRIQGLRMHAR